MATRAIPTQMNQVMVKKLTNNFRDATEIVQVPVPKPGAKQALVRVSYVAINASEILFTSGFYTPDALPPYPAGLEGMGEVVSSGARCRLKVGQYVAFCKLGCFSDYVVVEEDLCAPLPSLDPMLLNLTVSGVTASIALEKKGELKKGETVLVTAAAGATGQFAVQLAKLAGCHVIGTCSSEEKAAYLKSIGCDRTVIYTKESLNAVLTKEYPKGLDVVYEGVGNEMFDTCFRHMNSHGRVIVIGALTGYQRERSIKAPTTSLPLPFMTLQNSTDIRGFFLPHYQQEIPAHVGRLAKLIASGQLKVAVDTGEKSDKGPFKGFHMIYDALDYLYAKKNMGKVVVAIGC